MGHLLSNAVRFGKPRDVMAAGEGIETLLSLLSLFPALPMAAGFSAAHLPPSCFRRAFADFMCFATMTRQAILRKSVLLGDARVRDRMPGAETRCKDLNIDLRDDPSMS